MAKRLSKALRGKRRWLGVSFDSKYNSRNKFSKILDKIALDLELVKPLRLFDFVLEHNLPIDNKNEYINQGVAIIEASLPDSYLLREQFNSVKNLNDYGIESITTSGKIRLVRQRLNLVKNS